MSIRELRSLTVPVRVVLGAEAAPLFVGVLPSGVDDVSL
jgi:hypothetical protein